MSSNIITKTVCITNMTSVNCENIIERVLIKLPGTNSVIASYLKGTATVPYSILVKYVIIQKKAITRLKEINWYAKTVVIDLVWMMLK